MLTFDLANEDHRRLLAGVIAAGVQFNLFDLSTFEDVDELLIAFLAVAEKKERRP